MITDQVLRSLLVLLVYNRGGWKTLRV